MYSSREYSYTNSYNSAMTVIARNDHLTPVTHANLMETEHQNSL